MASVAPDFIPTRKKSFAAVSSSLKEEVKLTWKVVNFKDALKLAVERKLQTIATLPFQVGGGSQKMKALEWVLSWTGDQLTSKTISLHLRPDSNRCALSSSDLFGSCSGEVRVKKRARITFGQTGSLAEIRNFKVHGCGWDILNSSNFDDHLDTDGSLTLTLKVTVYLNSGKYTTVVECCADNAADEALDRKSREEFGNDVTSLLGDQKTSDVKISVMQGAMNLKDFYCHKYILSARSPVFCAMFEQIGMTESKEGVVRVEDVSVEVMEQFLIFVYSGGMKGKRKEGSDEPVWVELLPHLTYVADKYDVGSLRDFCDANLHRAVTKNNAVELYALAKRHRLLGAEAKLRSNFTMNVDVLLESVGS